MEIKDFNEKFKKQLFEDIRNAHGLIPDLEEKTILHYESIFDTFVKNNKKYKLNLKYGNGDAIPIIQAMHYSNTFKNTLNGQYNKQIIIEKDVLDYLIKKNQDIEVFLGEEKDNIVLYIVENDGDKIDYVKISDTTKISDVIEDINTLKNNFNKGLATIIDSLIDSRISSNTRKITIAYDTFAQFYNFNLGENGCAIIFPGIITENKPGFRMYEDTQINRMNLILVHAIKGSQVRNSELNSFVYYDTFQLCPPYAQGQTKC